jgi:hypothetical protein
MAILKCTCQNAYQDEVYGPGMRVCNPLGKEGRKDYARCTVCLREIQMIKGKRDEEEDRRGKKKK